MLQQRSSPATRGLLEPSLSGAGAAPVLAPYSETASFVAAFFGGPLAATAMFAADAWRLGRLGRDALPLAVAVGASIAAPVVLTHPPASLGAALGALGSGAAALTSRFAALLLFGLFCILRRREQRSARLFGLERPNPWPAAAAAVVFGVVSNALLSGLAR